jgi:hypothetical protein
MALNIHSFVTTAYNLTEALIGQPTVTHAAYTGQDAWGAPTYATGVSRKAVVIHKNRKVISRQGTEVVSGTQVVFIGQVAVNDLDQITLPDSTTPPIISHQDALDSSGNPYAVEVFL